MDKETDAASELEAKLAALDTEIADGEVMEPIEVEIGADGAGTVIETTTKEPVKDDDEPPATGKLPRRGQGRMDKRIGQLTARASEAELANKRIMDELAEERALRKKAEEKATVADAAALANYEQAAKDRVAKTKKDYADALDTGDKDKIADANVELTKAASDLAQVERYKRANPDKPKDAEPDDEGSEPEPHRTAPPPNPLFEKFKMENPWFEPGTQGAPNEHFRRSLHVYALDVGMRLEREYQAAGKPFDQEYWDKIADAVEKKFPEEFDGEPEPEPVRSRTPTMSADATDRGVPRGASQQTGNGAQRGQSERIKLSNEQLQLVKFNVENEIYKHEDGRAYTFKEGVVRMANAVAQDRREQAKLKSQEQ